MCNHMGGFLVCTLTMHGFFRKKFKFIFLVIGKPRLLHLVYPDQYLELGINIMAVLTIFECFSCMLECAFDEGT